MKHIKWPGYLATFAIMALAMALVSSPASAGNGYGRDNNPGKANGHAEGGHSSNGNGALASAMGSLNAAHASDNGLAHADAKSRVGMLAAYMDAMALYEMEYEAISDEDWETYNDLIGQISAIQDQIDDLEDEKNSLDPSDDEYATDMADLDSQIADLEDQKNDLQEQADDITEGIDLAAGDAADSLLGAANKDDLIDDTILEEVNTLLDGKYGDFNHIGVVHDEGEDDVLNIISPAE